MKDDIPTSIDWSQWNMSPFRLCKIWLNSGKITAAFSPCGDLLPVWKVVLQVRSQCWKTFSLGWKWSLFEVSSLRCQRDGGQHRVECVLFCAVAQIYPSCFARKPSPAWPLHKNRTLRWGLVPNGKDTSLESRLSSFWPKTKWPCSRVHPAVKVTDEWK